MTSKIKCRTAVVHLDGKIAGNLVSDLLLIPLLRLLAKRISDHIAYSCSKVVNFLPQEVWEKAKGSHGG